MSSTACSYQLPELPSFFRSFEVHTNRHCRNVSIASEAWLTRGGFGGVVPATTTASAPINRRRNSGSTRSRYRGAKIGLLAALCYPACDAPQLRLATDFLSLLILEGGHALLESEFNGSLQREYVFELHLTFTYLLTTIFTACKLVFRGCTYHFPFTALSLLSAPPMHRRSPQETQFQISKVTLSSGAI